MEKIDIDFSDDTLITLVDDDKRKVPLETPGAGRRENDKIMYGKTREEIDSEIEGMIYSDPQMYCTSLLSDLQEILTSKYIETCHECRRDEDGEPVYGESFFGDQLPVKIWPSDRENIRQTLNVVKRVLNVHMKNKGRHIDLGGSE